VIARAIVRGIHAALLAVAVAAMVQGCAAGRWVAGAPSAKTAPAEALLIRRCSGCHEIPNPDMMTADEWRASLVRMQRRMTLPASEWQALADMAGSDAGR